MTRDEALEELRLRLSDGHILRRSMAVEAIMKEFAVYFNADIQMWGLVGLLHDIDYEKTLDQPSKHGILGAEILENLDFDQAIVYSVKAHNDCNGVPRQRKMDKVLYLSDCIAEVILACETSPLGNISGVSPELLLNKIDEAPGNLRARLENGCNELELPLAQFLQIALKAVQKVTIL